MPQRDRRLHEIKATPDVQALVREAVLVGAMLADEGLRQHVEPRAFTHQFMQSFAESLAKGKGERKLITSFLKELGIEWSDGRVLDAVYQSQGAAALRSRAAFTAREQAFGVILNGLTQGNVDAMQECLEEKPFGPLANGKEQK